MPVLESWTFGRRLSAGLLLPTVLTAVMAVAAGRTVDRVVRAKNRLLDASGPQLITVDRARIVEARRVGAARGYLLTGRSEFRERYRQDDVEFQRQLARYAELDPSDETRRLVSGILRNYREYMEEYEQTARLRVSGKSLESLARRYESVVEPQRAQVDGIMTALVNREASQYEQDRARSDLSTFEATSLIYGVAALLLLTGVMLSSRLSSGLALAHERESEAARARGELKATQAAYQELQAVSYAISHNLRAPLRVIDAAARAALAPERGAGDPRRSLAAVRGSVGRMSSLLEALLEMLGVSSVPLRIEDVDLSALAEEILRELAPQGTLFSVEPGLRCRADPSLLRVALEKLLDNALKFSARALPPRVEVAAVPSESGCSFVVRDKGAGFDMSHRARLFVPFQRLHGQAEFPGTGMGLPVVARIVERHGGTVRAEAAPGRGAAFYVTLP